MSFLLAALWNPSSFDISSLEIDRFTIYRLTTHKEQQTIVRLSLAYFSPVSKLDPIFFGTFIT
jgi:hypothetical protein